MRLAAAVVACLALSACDASTNGGDDGGVAAAADAGGNCATSCDCGAGQTCAAGVCIDGIISVWCCSSETCPTGDVCQAPSGEVSLCGGAGARPPASSSPAL